MKYILLTVFVFIMFTSQAAALVVEGVSIESSQIVDGQELRLNGSGLRTVTVFHVKAYVAAFYSKETLRTPEEVDASTGPFRFDFTFVRAFDKKDVTKAWTLQFRESATYTYPGLKADLEQFAQYFGPIRKNGVETIELMGDTTRIIDDGVFKGAIEGKNFQKSFLSLWFGSNPVPGMKLALLGRDGNK